MSEIFPNSSNHSKNFNNNNQFLKSENLSQLHQSVLDTSKTFENQKQNSSVIDASLESSMKNEENSSLEFKNHIELLSPIRPEAELKEIRNSDNYLPNVENKFQSSKSSSEDTFTETSSKNLELHEKKEFYIKNQENHETSSLIMAERPNFYQSKNTLFQEKIYNKSSNNVRQYYESTNCDSFLNNRGYGSVNNCSVSSYYDSTSNYLSQALAEDKDKCYTNNSFNYSPNYILKHQIYLNLYQKDNRNNCQSKEHCYNHNIINTNEEKMDPYPSNVSNIINKKPAINEPYEQSINNFDNNNKLNCGNSQIQSVNPINVNQQFIFNYYNHIPMNSNSSFPQDNLTKIIGENYFSPVTQEQPPFSEKTILESSLPKAKKKKKKNKKANTNQNKNITESPLNPEEYLLEMFGRMGWICCQCNNFNYESN